MQNGVCTDARRWRLQLPSDLLRMRKNLEKHLVVSYMSVDRLYGQVLQVGGQRNVALFLRPLLPSPTNSYPLSTSPKRLSTRTLLYI